MSSARKIMQRYMEIAPLQFLINLTVSPHLESSFLSLPASMNL